MNNKRRGGGRRVHEHGEGPIVGQFYKLRCNVDGTYETIQRMIYIGYAGEVGRYVFAKEPSAVTKPPMSSRVGDTTRG